MRRTSIAILVVLAVAVPALPDERGALVGQWTGKSICTNVRPACHDEEAIYKITPTADPAVVSMSMAKVVDGKEDVMGVLSFHVDAKNHILTAEVQQRDLRTLWTFSWSGTHMTGTLKLLPKGDVVRNIDLKKE